MEETEGKVAIGVIRNQGKYLVMKRSEQTSSSGLWTFPGGKMEEDESVKEAAKREIKEETGLETKVLRTGDSYTNKGELGLWKIFPVLMESDTRNVEMNHEHSEHRWINLGELEGLETLAEIQAPEKLGLG
ncbi:MAG: DNA mismatch repair protein MutT [Nanohaloarchaea archaeon QH_8_44_6]|nr:MAG: DNA mismatch repair protein MutT [Nanohaloarchaea archaeon QH_8_44_6]